MLISVCSLRLESVADMYQVGSRLIVEDTVNKLCEAEVRYRVLVHLMPKWVSSLASDFVCLRPCHVFRPGSGRSAGPNSHPLHRLALQV